MIDESAVEILEALRLGSEAGDSDRLTIVLRDSPFESLIARGTGNYLVLGVRQPGEVEDADLRSDSASLTFGNAITLPGDRLTGPFMLLALESDSPELDAYVAAVFEGLLAYARTNWSQLRAAAVGAIDAFQSQQRALASLAEQVGLFGELLLIAESVAIDRLVDAWHQSRYAVHDFSVGQHRLEVKSSMSPMRMHWLSQAQTMPSPGETVTFCSLYVPPSASGTTLGELIEEICGATSSRVRSIFERKVAEVLPAGDQVRFDRPVAASSPMLVPATSIPAPSVSDPRITAVKWRVGFQGLATLPADSPVPWVRLVDSRGLRGRAT